MPKLAARTILTAVVALLVAAPAWSQDELEEGEKLVAGWKSLELSDIGFGA